MVMVKVQLYEREYAGNNDQIPADLLGFREWLDEIVKFVPAMDLPKVRIVFQGEEQYGEPWVSVQVFYHRPETPDEEAARLLCRSEKDARREREERAQLRALLFKYPDETPTSNKVN